jgi:hypothetical protein
LSCHRGGLRQVAIVELQPAGKTVAATVLRFERKQCVVARMERKSAAGKLSRF